MQPREKGLMSNKLVKSFLPVRRLLLFGRRQSHWCEALNPVSVDCVPRPVPLYKLPAWPLSND